MNILIFHRNFFVARRATQQNFSAVVVLWWSMLLVHIQSCSQLTCVVHTISYCVSGLAKPTGHKLHLITYEMYIYRIIISCKSSQVGTTSQMIYAPTYMANGSAPAIYSQPSCTHKHTYLSAGVHSCCSCTYIYNTYKIKQMLIGWPGSHIT